VERGILAIFHNVAPGREAYFDDWFQGEHLLERLAVPGFLYARRHKAISGAAGFFNFYITENSAVLMSRAYLERIENPTPRTKIMMSEIFRDMNRTVCRRDFRLGKICGGMTAAARFSSPPDAMALKCVLEEFGKDETVSGEIWCSAEQPGEIKEEEKLRGGDRKIRACLLVDVLHQAQAEKFGEQLQQNFPNAEVGVFRVLCHLGDGNA
jgi:hypothetical protein